MKAIRMKWVGGLLPLVFVVAAFAVAPAAPKEEAEEGCGEKVATPLCPVSGEEAKLSVRKDTDQGPVFFCCKDCIPKYEADPAKYKEKVDAQRKVLAKLPKIQEKCPVSGKPINKEAVLEKDGERVYFCCNNCKAKYEKDSAPYKVKLAASYTYLPAPACPITGEPIKFTAKKMTDQGPIYFCCPGCIKKYDADPAKYSDQVAAQRKSLAAMARVQVACPVSGKAVSKDAFTMQDGEKVYFCCNGCKAKYEKDPAAYKAKLADSYTYQARCPVMDEPIDPTIYVELAGQKVYVCCKSCIKKLKADPAKYAPALAEMGIHIDVEKAKAKS